MVSGPSGTGKGTICAGLIASTKAVISVSMTTRAPREHEEEGRSYYFVDKERFEAVIAEGGLFEYAEVYGEYYGTPKAPVIEQLDRGMDVILEIDVNGAMQVRENMPEAILVFIMPPSLEELRRRIESRGTESPEHIARRLERSEGEIAQLGNYKYCVVNDDLATAIGSVAAIMRAEGLGAGGGAGAGGGLSAGQDGSPKDEDAVALAEKLRIDGHAERIIERYKTGDILVRYKG